jgi:hypothetical protein
MIRGPEVITGLRIARPYSSAGGKNTQTRLQRVDQPGMPETRYGGRTLARYDAARPPGGLHPSSLDKQFKRTGVRQAGLRGFRRL